ncbi:MAG TPA: hypothetical protein VFT75_18660 [Nocardioidaceae bacterium]|nr:hypothetical protein [Nocardioidaceae bacterium]
MLVKVQHGATRWRAPRPNGQPGYVVRTAFRGMLVEIPDDQAQERLDSGAVVLPDAELPRGGRMRPLPSNGSDEELKAWVSVATKDEIDVACEQHPKLADRIRDAREQHDAALEAQNELQGGFVPGAPEVDGQVVTGNPDVTVTGTEVTTPVGGAGGAVVDAGDEDEDEDEVTDEELDDLVSETVTKVSEFLGDNPDLAQRVLDAETRRANAANEEPRKGVIEAARIAAAHTGD